jgi:hypothetical protein
VPIQLDGRLIGVAKLVVGSETSDRAFSTATSVLELIVTGTCQDALAFGAVRRSGSVEAAPGAAATDSLDG